MTGVFAWKEMNYVCYILEWKKVYKALPTNILQEKESKTAFKAKLFFSGFKFLKIPILNN